MSRTPGERDDLQQPEAVIDQPARVKALRGQDDVYTLFQLTHGGADSRCFIGQFTSKAAALATVEAAGFRHWEVWGGDALVTYHRA